MSTTNPSYPIGNPNLAPFASKEELLETLHTLRRNRSEAGESEMLERLNGTSTDGWADPEAFVNR